MESDLKRSWVLLNLGSELEVKPQPLIKKQRGLRNRV